jgi:hypothetical protein
MQMMNCLKGLKDDIEYSSPRIHTSSSPSPPKSTESNTKKYHNYIRRKVLAKKDKYEDF